MPNHVGYNDFEELRGPIQNKKITWLGDGNNVVYSLIEAAVQFDFELHIACPKGFEPKQKYFAMG
jgi:ornithine carbamoyltransferase